MTTKMKRSADEYDNATTAHYTTKELRDLIVEMLDAASEYVGSDVILDGGTEEQAMMEVRAAMLGIARSVAQRIAGRPLESVIRLNEQDATERADAKFYGHA